MTAIIRAVQNTREVARILSLPRRIWTEESAKQLSAELSPLLLKPGGTQSLRPIQAQSLYEIGTLGGAVLPIRVGGGKTLLSGLAPYVAESRRPLLLLPAKLIDKTQVEFRILRQQWHIPNFIRLMSYELLGRVQAKEALNQFQPDLIIADEAHKLRNRKAAVTKVVGRYLGSHPTCRFIAMSGTITKRSVKDYWHLIFWALGPLRVPLPVTYSEVEDWADAIDEKKNQGNSIEIGALKYFFAPDEHKDPPIVGARKAIGRRIRETPGIVSSNDGELGCSLVIEALWGDKEVQVNRAVEEAFAKLKTKWCAPDDWPLTEPMSIWRVARELSLGFYYQWYPRPPDWWRNALRDWAAWCREILTTNRRQLDSELQVTNAVIDGHYPDALPAYQAWHAVKDKFTPNTVPVWLDTSIVDRCVQWSREAPGIIWTEHTAFGNELAKRGNLSYYGRRGKDVNGRPIESHPPNQPLVASIASNLEGRNLQAFNRNLFTSMLPDGARVEQQLGRTHRDGQEADEVTVDVIVTSIAHIDAFWQAKKDAEYAFQKSGQIQKLLYADIIFPTEDDVESRMSHRWRKKL